MYFLTCYWHINLEGVDEWANITIGADTVSANIIL